MSDKALTGSPSTNSLNVNEGRLIMLYNKDRKPAGKVPVPSMSWPPIPPLVQPSLILGDPYYYLQSQLLSLYLTAETAHAKAISQRTSWMNDMAPLITPQKEPGPRAQQYYTILEGLEDSIDVSLRQMEDRASRFRAVTMSRQSRNAKTQEYLDEEELERKQRKRAPGRGRRSESKMPSNSNVVDGHILEEKQELVIFPDPQCSDFDEVKGEWEQLMQTWKPALRKSKGAVEDITDSF